MATDGTGNTFVGLRYAGGTQQSAFLAAATAATFWSKLAGGVNSIESAGTVVAPANLIVSYPSHGEAHKINSTR
jgi:hypothetical protein